MPSLRCCCVFVVGGVSVAGMRAASGPQTLAVVRGWGVPLPLAAPACGIPFSSRLA
eukprot:COSAG06_NODE_66937_length_253_cov_0.668831_1_plen_55_part_10